MSSAQGLKLLMEKGPNPGQEFEFSESIITIGKLAGANVNLPISSPTVSRMHSRISLHDGAWTIEDLGSSNGTFINGHRLRGETKTLNAGDHIVLSSGIELIVDPQASNPILIKVDR